MKNIYFELTEELNAEGPIALLASGQAVVYYRIAIMSKDGDWILREDPAACQRALSLLAQRGARYRPGAPLDVRWLAGGWSSHFEFADDQGRRIRCDFFSRPPRIPREEIDRLFSRSAAGASHLQVVAVEPLIRMKQTQRAKDYAVLAELARLLSEEEELELTTDPDRVLALAPQLGARSRRPCVRAAAEGEGRAAVVALLAQEIDELRQADHRRVETYQRAAEPFYRAFRAADLDTLPLPEAHARLCELAEAWLPRQVLEGDHADGHAQ